MRSRWVLVGAVAIVLGVPAPAGASSRPGAPGCPMFPADSFWHARVDTLPVDPNSGTYVTNAGSGSSLHPDFGAGLYAGAPIGIPFTTVAGTQPRVPINFDYADESDAGPYPVPHNAPIEGGATSTGDRHILVVDRDACRDYELYSAYPNGSGWNAGSGAIFDLSSNAMRPRTWTSADAAGLPILPGLVRYDEVASGEVDHAIRITLRRTDRRFVWPARHQAGSADATAAPMGAWLRLKSSVDVSRFGPQSRVVLRALQLHGGIVADNGSSWYISGAPDDRWDNNDLHGLGALRGSDFEFVDPSSMVTNPDSGRVATTPLRSDLPGGLTLDGFGGLHRFRIGTGPSLGAIRGGPYWNGWDIARGAAMTANHRAGYVLDGFGGLHPFGLGTRAPPPPATTSPYWSGLDVARGIALMPDGRSGYVVDAFGGMHRVAFGGAARPPRARGAFASPGQPLTRGVALLADGTGGYTVDQQGGLHPFAVGTTNPVAPPTFGAPHWTWSIARSVGV